MDNRNLVSATASRNHGLQIHRLVPNPSLRGRYQAAQMERRKTRWQGIHRLVRVRASAIRKDRNGRMGFAICIPESATGLLGERDLPVCRLGHLASANLAKT